ncbi:uncharacterized protein LOC119679685 [Teleopsis dalmanni]|uniref:uncharacterized protein LOC119679685 n=1 Tax=Teleopsis dalmanni TaxID=139649 RepID=UPI0018CFB1BC|nr:uncharacterized protein LOC119679685 [Teleopsis dalmanni]XP_037948104.1 uncharacterized protein LOC119679685 [Teleopsis dalmanni]XP_037948105.1 uncharacterized protein LOC119679685 [Teleopsis dalmanni]
MQTRISFVILCILHAIYAAPQLISFKDGKVGVNFGGYHAEAGLGGILTGNPAHGGLSASAGTPWGPQAAAGLQGNLNGRAAGFGYAGAQANPSVGAGAVLGGATDEGGFLGADAYANGKSTSKSVSGFFPPPESYQVPSIFSPNDEIIPTNTGDNVQKIKPPKKYSLFNAERPQSNAVHSKTVVKTVNTVAQPEPALEPVAPAHKDDRLTVSCCQPGIVNSALNIPIGILRSLQDSLSGFHVTKSVSVSK